MKKKVFVSGSMRIKNLDFNVVERLKNILELDYWVIVGDADGVDKSFQSHLKSKGIGSVVVYCTGEKPRNNLGDWAIKSVKTSSKFGTREYYTAKDIEMAKDCDYGFMVWDTKSTGTLSNAFELLRRKKCALVYINKSKTFIKVKNGDDFKKMLSFMSETSFKKADQKLRLVEKLEAAKFAQSQLFGT